MWPMASISAHLTVWTTSLTVHDLASMLGPEGRVSFQGNLRTPPRPVPKASGWSIRVWDDDSTDPATVLEQLLQQIAPLKSTIERLRLEVPDLDVWVGLTIRPPLPVLPVHFVPDQMANVA